MPVTPCAYAVVPCETASHTWPEARSAPSLNADQSIILARNCGALMFRATWVATGLLKGVQFLVIPGDQVRCSGLPARRFTRFHGQICARKKARRDAAARVPEVLYP